MLSSGLDLGNEIIPKRCDARRTIVVAGVVVVVGVVVVGESLTCVTYY